MVNRRKHTSDKDKEGNRSDHPVKYNRRAVKKEMP